MRRILCVDREVIIDAKELLDMKPCLLVLLFQVGIGKLLGLFFFRFLGHGRTKIRQFDPTCLHSLLLASLGLLN